MKTAIRIGPSEAEFTSQVIALANLFGWRTAHFRPGLTKSGKWRTAVQGDGKGFPDLILLRGKRLIVAELKVGRGRTTPEQNDWLEAFGELPDAEVWEWRPEAWEEIEKALK